MLGAAAGAVVMIGGVSLVTRRSRLSSDTAIGLLFVAMLALGVVIISASDAFQGDLIAILFGQILGHQLGAGAGDGHRHRRWSSAISALAARPFLLLSYDPEQADVAGFPSRRYHLLMLLLVALTVVVAFQTVGTLLVFGMLLAPAATGGLLAHRIGSMMVIAGVIGSLSTYVGLLISYWFDLAAGATIVLVAVSVFFVVFAITNVRDARVHVTTTDPSRGDRLVSTARTVAGQRPPPLSRPARLRSAAPSRPAAWPSATAARSSSAISTSRCGPAARWPWSAPTARASPRSSRRWWDSSRRPGARSRSSARDRARHPGAWPITRSSTPRAISCPSVSSTSCAWAAIPRWA